MRIGIVSNSESILPLVHTLALQKMQVYVFLSPSTENAYVKEKVLPLLGSISVPVTMENDSSSDLYTWYFHVQPDMVFISGYSHLIDVKRFAGRNQDIYNIHFGTLPSFRGPVPVFWQLKLGVEQLGVSIHRLSDRFDDGPLVWEKQTANLAHLNYHAANHLLAYMSIEGVLYLTDHFIRKTPPAEITKTGVRKKYYKRPQLEDVLINWQQMSTAEICRLVRACNPWNKGALGFYKHQEIKLMDACPGAIRSDAAPGTILDNKGPLIIACADQKTIEVTMLWYAGFFMPAYQCAVWGIQKGDTLDHH